MKPLFRAIAACIAVLMFACQPHPAPMDESDLAKVVDLFYHPGKPAPAPEVTYGLLSAKTREQLSLDQWKEIVSKSPTRIDSATMVRKEDRNGIGYGIVSFSETLDGKKNVSTATWVLENGKWRRLKLVTISDEFSQAYQGGDFAAASAKAENWLALDPFSIDAYKALLYCLEAADGKHARAGSRTADQIVKAVLSINPEDTTALFIAATRARERDVKIASLKKLEGTVAYQEAADREARNAEKEHLGHQPVNMDAEARLIQRLVVLSNMNRTAEFRRATSDKGFYDKLTAYLDRYDPDDRAHYAALLGIGFYKAGEKEKAAQWLEYGSSNQPNDADLEKLSALLGGKK